MQIALPIFDRFTALDAVGPYEVLSRLPGADLTFIAEERGPVRADTGALTLVAEATYGETPAPDVVVVPGGPGSRALLGDNALVEWLRAVHPGTTWTTSVCTGSLILAAAGILEGVEATTHWAATGLLEQLGAVFRDERVVVRGKVVTAAGVSSGIDMALTLAAEICDATEAQVLQLQMEYDPRPPFDAGSTTSAPEEIVAIARARAAAAAPSPPLSAAPAADT